MTRVATGIFNYQQGRFFAQNLRPGTFRSILTSIKEKKILGTSFFLAIFTIFYFLKFFWLSSATKSVDSSETCTKYSVHIILDKIDIKI